MDPLAITHNDPLGKFLLPVPITLSSIGTEILVPSGGMLLPVNIKSELKAQISDWPLWTLMTISQQAKIGIVVL